MITSMSAEELVTIGARLRAPQLTAQAGYTLGIARDEGPALVEILDDEPGEDLLAETEAVLAAVETARKDKVNAQAEAGEATLSVDDAIRKAKLWRRKVVARAQRLARRGKTVPAALKAITEARTGTALATQLGTMTAELERTLTSLGAKAADLLAAGKEIHHSLVERDADQERKRLAALPAQVRQFYEAKGRLYVALKIINDAGHELHSGDAEAAGRFNLKILHRRASRPKPVVAAEPTPT